ncbi:mediator of RNA polymerase II transcription complex subunit 8-domain-containing protein [Xylaria arbuscula]|nr:mediator of RNA polymerase II transcription complex subunit 8-domain-containing protein [Xylaria arbuscula]
MSSLGLSQEELKSVEQTRQRLSQLSSSLNSLKNDVFMSNPLPKIDSLQASADILNHNVHAILEILAQNNALFSRVAVHPSTNFPGRTQENILLQLLRKKPEPDVEAKIDKGRETLATMSLPGNAAQMGGAASAAANPRDKEAALGDIWGNTRNSCQERIAEYVVNEEGDYFTAEEHDMGIENVRTGLQRNFEDEYEDDDEDMEDEEAGAGAVAGASNAEPDLMIIDRPPPPPAPAVSTQEVEGATLETILRLATRGRFAG